MTAIEEFYDQNPQYEWGRLERHRTEFAVTLCAFQDYLPKPPARILDIGGGPGRYAITLAQQGYQVTLLDLSKNCLEFARDKATEAAVNLEGYVRGNAMDLARFPGGSFDVVLLMGPLYHLLAERDRHRAVSEAGRVLKPGGCIFSSFITRYAPLRDVARHQPAWIVEHPQRLEELLTTGALRSRPGGGFTDAYFAHPSEIGPLMEQNGFLILDLIGCEGVVSMIEEQVNGLTGELWQAWVELNYRLGKDPAVHGAVEHLLCVGRKVHQWKPVATGCRKPD